MSRLKRLGMGFLEGDFYLKWTDGAGFTLSSREAFRGWSGSTDRTTSD